ncbi:coiled-coil domain-containing protein 86 [Trichoplusia ni]|uniref:Coiled-coil domain-containing protein 86 n=1 Tax=Trichoplusia ni TaxID=7111 RepID=A0A7E5WJZ7_TRINI|nr:coiled-coil domain-containing protein 86 [Trichoplusia ni]
MDSEETNNKVLDIVANIVKKQEDKGEQNDEENSTSKVLPQPIRGIPKSGRFWKSKKEKFSTINKTKGLRNNFEKKTALRIEMKKTRELSKQMLEEIKQKELERKERRRENIKRTEENKRKAEVVQVITNTAKLKRMRKKQLRFIEKRDTNKQVEANK